MDLEHKAAHVLNVTMITILGVVVLGFFIWSMTVHLAAVRNIYTSLSFEEKRHVNGFGVALVNLPLLVILVRSALTYWLRPRRDRQPVTPGAQP